MSDQQRVQRASRDTALKAFPRGQTRRLVVVFFAWKLLLTVLAALCPGPGYDTSGRLLLTDEETPGSQFTSSTSLLNGLALKNLRWDALYFVKAAQRGYLYEQEWAFSLAYSTLLRTITNYVAGTDDCPLKYYVWAGMFMSSICHLISVLVLYQLAKILLGPQQSPKIPFIASVLHIISPAGIFLLAPYAESMFSALNFTGMFLYAMARRTGAAAGAWTVAQDAYMLSAGLSFALGTLIRSNGLLSGLILLYDAAAFVPRIMALQLDWHEARRMFATCVAGGILACGFFLPQLLAYQEYCGAASHDPMGRPWCGQRLPSIYSWVQRHYWGVGFLRYWTFSNLPLFLMAGPMLWLLSKTSVTVLQELRYRPVQEKPDHRPSNTIAEAFKPRCCNFPQLAIPQLVLTVAAMTNFHVQIINRISSGYPLWYMVVANWIVGQGITPRSVKEAVYSQWAVRGMVLYAIVQGLLFAGFLPPA